MNRCEIEQQVDNFLKLYPIDYPVDIFDLAQRAGYEVFRFHPSKNHVLPKISGALVYQKRHIFINGDEALSRQRFTCAHELGHAVLHQTDMVDVKIAFRIDGEFNKKEIVANQFAAALLMPTYYLKDLYKSLAIKKNMTECIEELAKYFQVSNQTMFYRLRNLKLIQAGSGNE